jgi:hypothetical protein
MQHRIFPGETGCLRAADGPGEQQNNAVRRARRSVVGIFDSIGEWVASTRLPEQVREVDLAGLFTNPWFMVPFVALVGYLLYKKALRDLVILGAILGMWWASGTTYMQTLVVDGELQINKVLPVLFGGAAVLGLVIYLLIGRSD